MVLTCVAAINEEITIYDIPPATLKDQLASVTVSTAFTRLAAIKIGLLHTLETIELVEKFPSDPRLPDQS